MAKLKTYVATRACCVRGVAVEAGDTLKTSRGVIESMLRSGLAVLADDGPSKPVAKAADDNQKEEGK